MVRVVIVNDETQQWSVTTPEVVGVMLGIQTEDVLHDLEEYGEISGDVVGFLFFAVAEEDGDDAIVDQINQRLGRE